MKLKTQYTKICKSLLKQGWVESGQHLMHVLREKTDLSSVTRVSTEELEKEGKNRSKTHQGK